MIAEKSGCARCTDLQAGLTVIIPAYNEAALVGDTIRSLQSQTRPPEEIILVDDCSTDGTGDIGLRAGITVLRPPQNTGSKAGAQNFALPRVNTEFVMAIDADTTLAPDAIDKLMESFDDPGIGAACGFVLPRHVKSIWERGRYIEYLFAFTFYKQVQDYYRRPLISSGCFSMYRTRTMRSYGGWPGRTLAEDMDLTWSFHQAGVGVRFVPEAVCYPVEPHNFQFMDKQLHRWSHGFIQNVTLHWRGLLHVSFLRSAVAVALWDAIVASFVFLFVLPLLMIILQTPWLLLAYFIDAPALLVPLLVGAAPRKEVRRMLSSLPSFFVLRLVNGYYFLEAIWSEWCLQRPALVYEKGH
ncbi:MAG: glycosyltransferase family 2 protein [Gammaproteobacteria bacterium]|nr:glycosyltransferase family 2 protein [Gammaproteobacteria bacterium]